MKKQEYMQSLETLGSTAELRIVTEDASDIEVWFSELWGKVTDFNDRFSRFKSDSELSLFNQRAGERVSISPAFKQILEKVQYFSALTEGIFNPFILPNLQRAGYVHSMTDALPPSPDHSGRRLVGFECLEVGSDWAQIPPQTALDLGGIGKGYLADELAVHLSRYTTDYCLSLGGDMRVSGQGRSGPWSIDVESSQDSSRSCASYSGTLGSYGIATSGTLRTKVGKTQPHLIDPHTGMPAKTLNALCTVVAKDAVSADVLASCILIGGTEMADRICKTQHVDAVLLQGSVSDTPRIWGEGFTLADNVTTEVSNTPYAYI
jgi:thiamine biosynthesis lipoprotein